MFHETSISNCYIITYTGINNENYTLSNLTYDKNGNIKTLNRNGKTGGSTSSPTFGPMDNLTYTYNGNRMTNVTDAISSNNTVDFVQRSSGAYSYYPDGSLLSDNNEQITDIKYDWYLKQPIEITLSDGRKINHTYDGSGKVLKTTYSTGEVWDFDGNIISKNGVVYQTSTPEGRAVYQNNLWSYEFFHTDHLGNTRVSYKANGTTLEKTAETAFDPWGVVLNGVGNVNATSNRYEFQGKESEKTFGLNRINLGARTMNPTTGRFDRVDRMSYKYLNLSTYNYVANNPTNLVDPDGNEIGFSKAGETIDKKTGVTTVTYNVNVSMSVMNSSNMSRKDFQSAVSSFTDQLTKSLTSTFSAGDKTQIAFQAGEIDVRSVSSMSDVKNTDHLMVVVDDVTGKDAKGGEAGGLAVLGGKVAYVQQGSAYGVALNMVHEFGHNMGLSHNFETSNKGDDGTTNHMGYNNVRSQFAGVQLLQSLNKSNAHPSQLNIGNNYEILKQDYNTNGYTTQQMPLQYNVGRGNKIPKTLGQYKP